MEFNVPNVQRMLTSGISRRRSLLRSFFPSTIMYIEIDGHLMTRGEIPQNSPGNVRMNRPGNASVAFFRDNMQNKQAETAMPSLFKDGTRFSRNIRNRVSSELTFLYLNIGPPLYGGPFECLLLND